MNNRHFIALSLGLIVLLPGCLGKKQAKSTNTSKGIPVNMPLDEKSASAKVSFFENDVEAFVLQEDPTIVSANTDGSVKVAFGNENATTDLLWQDSNEAMNNSFDPIYFDYDSHTLTANNKKVLESDIQKAKQLAANETLVVKGHSCNKYLDKAYNIVKSDNRAHEVAKEFEKAGITNIKVFGVGAEEADNTLALTKEAQAPNRKVEIYTITA